MISAWRPEGIPAEGLRFVFILPEAIFDTVMRDGEDYLGKL
jgi:hypothetical protein